MAIWEILHLNEVALVVGLQQIFNRNRNYVSLISSIVFPFILLLDIDECKTSLHNCHPNSWCNNTVGSFSCNCNIGYFGNGINCTGRYLGIVFQNQMQVWLLQSMHICNISSVSLVLSSISLHDFPV